MNIHRSNANFYVDDKVFAIRVNIKVKVICDLRSEFHIHYIRVNIVRFVIGSLISIMSPSE